MTVVRDNRTTSQSHQDTIVLHVSGPDRPGVTSMLAETIASEGARLLDIGQSVLHGYLVLSAIVEIPPGNDTLKRILFAVNGLGLRLDVSAFDGVRRATPTHGQAFCLTLLGELEDARGLSLVTRFLAARKINIREIAPLTEDKLLGLELTIDLPTDPPFSDAQLCTLRGDILKLASETRLDLAVQKDDIFRRNRRLVCMDVDSTFVQMEVIDELAGLMDCKEQCARITEAAMRGELDFRRALEERVKLFKGLPMEKARTLCQRVPMMPGAETLTRRLKALGFKVGLFSGGFDFFVDDLKERFGLDFAFANQLEVADGVLTGRVVGSIVDAERKAQLLKDMAKVFGYHIDQAIAIGDGANDMLMLQAAGLGIAYRAKPKLQAVADISLNQGGLDALLLLMGFNMKDLRTL